MLSITHGKTLAIDFSEEEMQALKAEIERRENEAITGTQEEAANAEG